MSKSPRLFPMLPSYLYNTAGWRAVIKAKAPHRINTKKG